MSEKLDSYMREIPLPGVRGRAPQAGGLAVRIGDRSIAELSDMSSRRRVSSRDRRTRAACARYRGTHPPTGIRPACFLVDVGHSLPDALSRCGHTVGRRAGVSAWPRKIGSGLVGVIYVLDRRSACTSRQPQAHHATLERLRDLEQHAIVVGARPRRRWRLPMVVDIGPGAGETGAGSFTQGRSPNC